MKKALFVYNPLSGNRNVPKELDYIVSRFIGTVPCLSLSDWTGITPLNWK